jgi:CheY-like chemotaxis protein
VTISLSRPAVPPTAWRPRDDSELLRSQLAAIEAWNASRRAIEKSEAAAMERARSREMRLDLARRTDVVRRQHEALIARTDEQLRGSARVVSAGGPPRAIVVHRNDWFKDKVIAGLLDGGVEVVARLENGADAVGVAVAEQPDLLLVEDKLPMIGGEDVVRQVLQFAPDTIAAAQVSVDEEIAVFLDAGARTAFTRRVPPGDVAREMCAMVRA